jgi:small GTP-binding protein
MDIINDDINIPRNDNDFEEESIKVVLIGESGVGKTSIIAQFTKGEFSQDLMTTNGATFSTKKKEYIKEKKILCFEIWDTAGREKYRSLSRMFFKESSVAIIVYDITSKSSFEEIKNYWMSSVKENAPKEILLYIVGNKIDLSEREAVNEDEVREYAQKENVLFWSTSARDATGINDLFDDIGQRYLCPDFNNCEENKERKNRKNEAMKVEKETTNKTEVKKRFC